MSCSMGVYAMLRIPSGPRIAKTGPPCSAMTVDNFRRRGRRTYAFAATKASCKSMSGFSLSFAKNFSPTTLILEADKPLTASLALVAESRWK